VTGREALLRRLAVAICAGMLALVAAGCGGGSDSDSPAKAETTTATVTNFTATQVEKIITRTIKPTLAANLGDGYTMTVDCAVAEPGFRCEYQAYAPNGKPVKDQRVIYAVTCEARCSWIPIG
jgi:hypothetical protein